MKIADEVKVWDPLVRLFHWSLVTFFFIAYLSEHDWFAMHIWAGFTVTGLVAFRVLWGMVGTEHARFSDFVFSPKTIFNDLKAFIAWRPVRYLGHSPAGGAMVLAILLSLTAVILTGMQLYAVAEHAGPFVAIQAQLSSVLGESAGSKYYWADLHGLFVNFTLLLVFVHVICVVACSVALRENLPYAMITGKKPHTVKGAAGQDDRRL